MSIRLLDHTADVGIEIEARSLEALYAESLLAFTDIITGLATVAEAREWSFTVAADSSQDLWVEMLEQALFLFETEALLPARAAVTVAAPTSDAAGLHAQVHAWGEVYSAERHPLKVLIKGVTYHQLEVEELAAGRWRGRVIFDI